MLVPAVGYAKGAAQLAVTNPIDADRTEEVVEVPLAQVLQRLHVAVSDAASIVAQDAASGERIATQIEHSNAAAPKLLLLVHLHAVGSESIAFHVDAAAAKLKALVFGREAQERKDDFAWENELVTYRVYGPALEATGEIASGIDVWSKRVPNFVIDSFYKRDALGAATHNPALSYHKDDGVGLDSYYVGPTRGCGGTAVFAGGKLFTSKNYKTRRILADGPIRFSFEVSYAPWDANGVSVSETKRITLDAGTHLNRIESTYTFAGLDAVDLAAGIAVHEGATGEIVEADSIASVWDTPQEASAGRIATGLIAPVSQDAHSTVAANHALMVFKRHSGEGFTYYAGSGWSKADMPAASDWNAYLKLQSAMIEHPLTVQWAGK
jgi:hypothetical protein